MKLPGTEKRIPAFRQLIATLALSVAATHAVAGADEDYEEGLAAYRVNDVVSAMGPLKRAADTGHADAQALYATILDSAELDEEAAAYFGKASAQNNPDGMYGLAKMYLTGEAPSPDRDEAGKLMRAAAAAGHRLATLAMASAFIRGDVQLGASDQSSPEARTYIQQAAEMGDTGAMSSLAEAYRSGKFGLPVDAEKAKEWELKLANALSGTPKGARR